MEKEVAIEIKARALAAIEQLTAALLFGEGRLTKDEFRVLKKGVGLAIGAIEMQVNDQLYRQYPDLED